MSDYTDEEYEEVARRWRQAAGMADAIRLDAPEFVRWLKRAGYVKDYVCVSDQQLPTDKGKYDPDKRILFYRQSIWEAAEKGDPHARWTLIHEGCHAMLGHTEVRFRGATNRHSRRTRKDEIATDHLTACVLAPFEKAQYRPGMKADDIQQKFGLSATAATKRLEEYERLFRQQTGTRRELPPTVTDFLLHQKRKGHQVTSVNDLEALLPRSEKQYDGDPCPCCNELALVRKGLFKECQNCGARTGEE